MSLDPNAVARVTHRFTAGAERVFAAWLDPATVARWLFVTSEDGLKQVNIDARVGGQFILVDRRGEIDAVMSGAYLEIDPPRRLVFTLFSPDYSPLTTKVSIDITPLEQGCELRLTAELGPDLAARRKDLEEGWREIFDTLGRVVD
jgi:uncharacterized protein YndB with AHSA1/START domain